MIVKEVVKILDEFYPFKYAEEYDNVGLILGENEDIVNGILICLDTIESVVDEAIQKQCNLIVSFHPIIFNGLKTITGKNYVEKVVKKCLKNNISIIAIHTAMDNSSIGVNKAICDKLELENSRILMPKNNDINIGLGMTGELNKLMSENEFIDYVKLKFNINQLRHSKLLNRSVKEISVLGGSGSFAIEEAIKAGSDVFLTSDLKYHDFFKAENDILLLDIGHYESEQYTKKLIHTHLTKKITNFAIVLSDINTNPVKYS